MTNQQRWGDTRGWMRRADRCSGVTGSTWPGRDGPFDRRWGSPLLPWGTSCLSQAARRSPKEENKGSAGQTHAWSHTTARRTLCDSRELHKNTSRQNKSLISSSSIISLNLPQSISFSFQFLILQFFSASWPKYSVYLLPKIWTNRERGSPPVC